MWYQIIVFDHNDDIIDMMQIEFSIMIHNVIVICTKFVAQIIVKHIFEVID